MAVLLAIRSVLVRSVNETIDRIRERGRTALFRATRLTGATVAAYIGALILGFDDPPPLIAALTALIVVQVTLFSTLQNGVQRVLSVVSGVALAVVLARYVGLTWWSLGGLVAASIIVGQLLRLGPHLVEVPISAMLVLGVGFSSQAESVGVGRVFETVIGALVGVLVNLVFPPPVQTRYAGDALDKFAQEISGLLRTAAAALTEGRSQEAGQRWLEDSRRLNRHVPRVDRALAHAEESRVLNHRALSEPMAGLSLRDGLDSLEHCSVGLRTLFRAIHDAMREDGALTDDSAYAVQVWATCARALAALADVVAAFGHVVRAEIDTTPGREEAELAVSLEVLRDARNAASALLTATPGDRPGLWGMNSTLLMTADRMLRELDVAEHARLRAEHQAEAAARRRSAARGREGARQPRQLPVRPRQRRPESASLPARTGTPQALGGSPGRSESTSEGGAANDDIVAGRPGVPPPGPG